jgi:nucleotide-binding universal stress UspA family protein
LVWGFKKKMFRNILVPLDSSSLAEIVLPHTTAIAQISNAQVHLLHVMEQHPGGRQQGGIDPFDWQMLKVQAETYLGEVKARLEKSGLQVAMHLAEGNAAESVIDFAQSQKIDLILLSSHGQSGISGWNVSSVVQKIILRAYTSVMIMRAYHFEQEKSGQVKYQRILVPLDGSQRAECVIPLATALARSYQATLVLAHVVRQPEMPRRTPPSLEDTELSNRVIERNKYVAESYLADLVNRLDVVVDTRLLISPDVYGSLHNLAEQENADLVLLSAHGYTGGMQWPYGNVVVSFVAYGSSPLLIVQDLPRGSILPTRAELIAREQGVH